MNNDPLAVFEEFDSYLSFINYFDLYRNNYSNFKKELYDKHLIILNALENKRVQYDDFLFERFTKLLDMKMNDLLYPDFDELECFNKWLKEYNYGVNRSSIRLTDVIRITEHSQLDYDLLIMIDDNIINYPNHIYQLQSEFIKIAVKSSLKEIKNYYNSLINFNELISKRKKYKLKSVALYYRYSINTLNSSNKDIIGKKFGFKNGNKLFQEYNKFAKRTDIIGMGTDNQNRLKHMYFEQALELLNQDKDSVGLKKCENDQHAFNQNTI